ncbi:MAG: hypothetical protein IIX14_01220 [Clostridia bacterium]|nr:hypothetical protein [Clostridia bacterium]
MAQNKKKRPSNSKKSQQKKANRTLLVMLVVIIVIIAIFAFKALSDDKPVGGEITSTDTQAGYSDDNRDDFSNNESDDEDDASESSQTEETSEKTSEEASSAAETTTEMITLPINHEAKDSVDIIIDHYTDYMGFPEGALFIRASESSETANGFRYTLRLNANGSPNKLIGDIFVEKGTGKVTDSMGNEPWYLED